MEDLRSTAAAVVEFARKVDVGVRVVVVVAVGVVAVGVEQAAGTHLRCSRMVLGLILVDRCHCMLVAPLSFGPAAVVVVAVAVVVVVVVAAGNSPAY